MGGYSGLARVYDRLTDNVGYPQRAEYIASLLAENGAGGGSLLDLACGTARLSVLLAKYGYDIVAVDSSVEMLSEAMGSSEVSEAGILLINQKMQELDLFGTVGAAVCSLDSINHLTHENDVRETFRRVALFVEKGGVFVFDVNTPYKHREVLADNCFVYDLDDVYCVWQNSLCEDKMTVDISLDIFTREGDSYFREEEHFSERAYNISDITRWLTEVGFEVIGVYDEMTHNPLSDTSQRAYFAAKRK